MLLSILHAADFAELYERDILPALKRGAVSMADAQQLSGHRKGEG
jgi:thymidylate kinase